MPGPSPPFDPIFILIPTLVLIPPTPPPPATPRLASSVEADTECEVVRKHARKVDWPFSGLVVVQDGGEASEISFEVVASVSTKQPRQHPKTDSGRTQGVVVGKGSRWRRTGEKRDKHAQLVRVDRKIESAMLALGF